MATTKLNTLDTSLKAVEIGSDENEKPNRAQTANRKNIPARENRVYLDNVVKGDSVSSENVEISTRNRGRKKRSLKSIGEGGMGG